MNPLCAFGCAARSNRRSGWFRWNHTFGPGHEQPDREQREPEVGHRDPDVREPGDRVVADRVLLHRRVHAERERDDHRRRSSPRTAAAASATARGGSSPDTGSCRCGVLVPRSPRTKWVSQSHHCTTIGWSRPSALPLLGDHPLRSSRMWRYFASGSIDGADQPERDERRDEQHRDRGEHPAHEISQHRATPPVLAWHHDRPRAIRVNAT